MYIIASQIIGWKVITTELTTIPCKVKMDEEPIQRPHAGSFASSSEGDHVFEEQDDGAEDTADSGMLSDSETNDAEDFAYYQDVYRFVGAMKEGFQNRKISVDWETIQRKKTEVTEEFHRKKDEVKEAVISSKERIKEKSREKLDAGKQKILKLRKKTYKRLKRMEPEESYRQKVVFTKSVLTLVLKTFAVCSGQWLLPWYYAITYPTLIFWRIITYWQAQFQYFCLDFCYFGNLIISLIMWFDPSNPELCSLLFSISNGILYLGAFSFRNSLVFHSVDKMTSTYIHTVPLLLSFGIRWYPEETSRYWHASFPTDPILPSWKWNVLVPFLVFATHTVFYTLLVNVILQPEEHIVTSYRYITAKKSIKKIFGPNPPYYVYVTVNWILCVLISMITLVFYKYFYAHVLGLCLLFWYVTWNGAGYYFDVFKMSMSRKNQVVVEKEE